MASSLRIEPNRSVSQRINPTLDNIPLYCTQWSTCLPTMRADPPGLARQDKNTCFAG